MIEAHSYIPFIFTATELGALYESVLKLQKATTARTRKPLISSLHTFCKNMCAIRGKVAPPSVSLLHRIAVEHYMMDQDTFIIFYYIREEIE